MPKPYAELLKVRTILEKHFKDVQDIEFTIQEGKLFMLQTRNGKRTAAAALKFSMDMVKEKLIDWETAVLRNPADQLDQLLAPDLRSGRGQEGQGHSPRVFLPALVPPPARSTSTLTAPPLPLRRVKSVLLVRNETSPEDLRGMIAAEGILTAKGGVSSHAALVARQMGKVCICGASAVQIDYDKKTVTVVGETFQEGDYLSHRRHQPATVYGGRRQDRSVAKSSPACSQRRQGRAEHREVQELPAAHEVVLDRPRACDVRTNADNPEQTQNAIAFGAVRASA